MPRAYAERAAARRPGLTVVDGRVVCPAHDPCPSGQAKWEDVQRYNRGAAPGDEARFTFVTRMWLARDWAGTFAPAVERDFIAAHRPPATE